MNNQYFTDQIEHQLFLPKSPQRIISLVPSQTELLFDLGLSSKIVGITKFCIHPKEKCKETPKIGGTKKFHFDKISQLQPDLIIANKEENYKEGIEELQRNYPVWTSDIYSLADAYQMMKNIGIITNTGKKAIALICKIKQQFQTLKGNSETQRVLYLIWRTPYMAAGKDTFINEMLETCGFENCVTENRYPILSAEKIKVLNPKIILLSSEPYPFKKQHFEELQQICKASKIKLVAGEMFSWYGSRLQYAAAYFKTI